MSRWQEWSWTGRQIEMTQSAHLAPGNPARRTTTTLYNPGDLAELVIDPLSHKTAYRYDGLNRRFFVLDAMQAPTFTNYDRVGNVIGVLDAVGNLTTFNYDALNRVTSEINALPTAAPASRNPTRTFSYDASNNRTSVIDRNGRERRFGYDVLNRTTTETWHDTLGGPVARTLTYLYDAANNLLDATDRLGTGGAVQSKYAATYDRLGRATSVTNAGTPGHPTVQTDSTFNAASERTQLAIPGASGLTNNYQYDTLSRMTRIEQTGAAAAKLVTLAYNKVSQFTGISRYSDLTGTNLVARADYAYETSGTTSLSHRLTTMTYTGSATALATYSWGWDPADRITQQTIVSKLTTTITSTETSNYGYNFRNELTGATHTGFTPNEGYVYDGTGNRTGGTYSHPVNNEMAADNAGNTVSVR